MSRAHHSNKGVSMKTRSLRRIIVVVIALLVISELARLTSNLMGHAGGLAGAIIPAAVYFYCARKARAGVNYTIWILAPTLIFGVIPTVAKVWGFFADEDPSLMQRALEYGPFFISFVLPVVLLVFVYIDINKHPD
jgi:hypothetical protein